MQSVGTVQVLLADLDKHGRVQTGAEKSDAHAVMGAKRPAGKNNVKALISRIGLFGSFMV